MTLVGWMALTALRVSKQSVEALSPVLLRQLELVDKTASLAAASDLQAYQGIQAMGFTSVGYDGDTYDPSDEAEAHREAERKHQDPEVLSEDDREALRALFG